MSTRAPAHAKQEKAIFDAFLVAYQSFAEEVEKIDQPNAPFPDVVVELAKGGLVDFELGEWLDGPQTGAAKRYDADAEAMIAALGSQGVNPSPHFRALMLCPRDAVSKFEAADQPTTARSRARPGSSSIMGRRPPTTPLCRRRDPRVR
jgi:hypothetical protein